MTPFLNRITVMGLLGKTPELRYLNDGTAATSVNIAYSEKYRDRHSGEYAEKTEWFVALLYGNQAETVCRLMSAGDGIQVHGKMRSRHYTDKTGTPRSTWEILADSVQMIALRTPKTDNTAAADVVAQPAVPGQRPSSLSDCL